MEYNVNIYKEMLLEENERQNLVSRSSVDQELDKHVEDSLSLLEFEALHNKQVVDIGSGAGFPGLILALKCPEAQITLIESDQKKCQFLSRVKNEMRLDNIQIIPCRIEEAGRNYKYREGFDICTSRAVAAMNILLEYGLPLIKVEGKLLIWKGKNYAREIAEAANALNILKASVIEEYHYRLKQERDRVIIVVKKWAQTPEKYPRRVGVPAKRPL